MYIRWRNGCRCLQSVKKHKVHGLRLSQEMVTQMYVLHTMFCINVSCKTHRMKGGGGALTQWRCRLKGFKVTEKLSNLPTHSCSTDVSSDSSRRTSMNQRENTRVNGVCALYVWGGSFCVCVGSGLRCQEYNKMFLYVLKAHINTASLAYTAGQMFISDQYEHKEITAKSYHLSSIIALLQ